MENLLVPYQAVERIGDGNILVLAPHPDDEIFGCGGAIIRHVKDKNVVTVVVLSDGGAQKHSEEDKNVYVLKRREESIEASRLIGYAAPTFWDYPDREILYGEKLVQNIENLLDNKNIDIVYAPSIYEIHPDHQQTGLAALEAVRRSDRADLRLAMYEIGMPIRPNALLDISELFDLKRQAMSCFQSQLENQDYLRHISSLNQYRTYTLPASVKAAEAYFVSTSQELRNNLVDLFTSEYRRQQKLGLPVDYNRRPLVSVIVRSMDRESLGDALDSISRQTYPRIEVIVVNAKGKNHKKLGSWCGRYPLRFIESDEPKSRSQAANVGLEYANGDYLIFLDEDDLFDSDHIAKLVKTIDTIPGSLVAYSGVRCINEEAKEPVKIFNAVYDPIRLLIGNYIPINSVLFSAQLLKKRCRFDEAIDLYEDWDFWIQVSQHTDFLHSNKVTASYRIMHGTGLGIIADEKTEYKARLQILNKWRNKWTNEQLFKLMETADKKRLLGLKNDKLLEKIHTLNRELEAMKKERTSLLKEIKNKDEELNSLISSRSWRTTKPLRILWRLFG